PCTPKPATSQRKRANLCGRRGGWHGPGRGVECADGTFAKISRNGGRTCRQGVSLPVTRPAGRALLVGSDSCRPAPLRLLRQLGFHCEEAQDPYAAMAELARRPLAYWALVLSLNSLYREELPMIAAVKRRWPN